MKQPKTEEQIAKKYLDALSIGNVSYEPEDPPDLVLASKVGVEVRRLNENYFGSGKTKGLEQVDIPLHHKLREVLTSYDGKYEGHSYYIGLIFERPLVDRIAKIGDEMRRVLDAFLGGTRTTPQELRVNKNILLEIFPGSSHPNRVFLHAVTADDDSGGVVVQLYAKNISHCIAEKNQKIASRITLYSEWWLLLVDSIGAWSLMPDEVQQVKDGIIGTGDFKKIIVIDCFGNQCLLEIS